MKLHERTLWYDSVSLAVKDATGVAYACSVDEEDGPLFSAAPDMARALLEHGSLGGHDDSEWHTTDCWEANYHQKVGCTKTCQRTRVALCKAGVTS